MKPGGRVIKTLTSGKRYFKAFQKQQKKLESIRQRNFRFSRCKITIDGCQIFGEMTFGARTFGEMTFGERLLLFQTFGDLDFW